MKTLLPRLLVMACLALLAACAPPSDSGSAELTVSVPQALSSSVSRVSVTASAADFPSASVELVSANGVWGGILGNLPAGANRSFLAQAFDASNDLLFEGSASGISITANQRALVAITLQQAHASPPFQNEAPVIESLASASSTVSTGGVLSLTATVRDPNAGDTLSYAWSSTAGTFSSASATTTTWTAPASTGIQSVTFTVTDSQGLSSSLALAISVTPSSAQGNAAPASSFHLHHPGLSHE